MSFFSDGGSVNGGWASRPLYYRILRVKELPFYFFMFDANARVDELPSVIRWKSFLFLFFSCKGGSANGEELPLDPKGGELPGEPGCKRNNTPANTVESCVLTRTVDWATQIGPYGKELRVGNLKGVSYPADLAMDFRRILLLLLLFRGIIGSIHDKRPKVAIKFLLSVKPNGLSAIY